MPSPLKGIRSPLEGIASPFLSRNWFESTALLAYDHVNQRYMEGGINVLLTDAASTTRATNGFATSVSESLSDFAINIARRTNKGLLTEPTKAKLSPYSEPYDDSAIFGGGNSGTSRITVDWLGEFTKAASTAYDGSTAFAYATPTLAIGKNRVGIYVRASDGSAITPSFTTGTGDFAITVSGSTRTDLTTELLDADKGIYSVMFTADVAVAGVKNLGILQYVGQAGKTIEWSGVQIETGEVNTSYYPTTGAPATRNEDDITENTVATKLASLTSGILVVEIDIPNINQSGAQSGYLTIDGGGLELSIHSDAANDLIITMGTSTLNFGTLVGGIKRFAIFMADAGDFKASLNGSATISNTGVARIMSSLTRCVSGGDATPTVDEVSRQRFLSVINESTATDARLEGLAA